MRLVPRGVVPERLVKGRLGQDAVHHIGVQGIGPSPQAHQDVAPASGEPQGLGEGVRLVSRRSFGGENLPGSDALADQDSHPLGQCIPDAPWDSKGAH